MMCPEQDRADRGVPWIAPPFDDCIILSDYAEALEVLRRSTDFQAHNARGSMSLEFLDGTLLSLDGEPHMALRRLLARLMSPRSLDEYRQMVTGVLRADLRAVQSETEGGSSRIDLVLFMHNVLWRLGARIVGIDVSSADIDRLELVVIPAAEGVTVQFSKKSPEPVVARARTCVREFAAEFYAPSKERREILIGEAATEGDSAGLPLDMLTLLLTAKIDADADGSVLRNCIVTLAGSVGNTTATICHTLSELDRWVAGDWDNPDLADDNFIAKAVNESIRLHRTGDPYLIRLTRADEDFTLSSSGRNIARGTPLALDIRKINRDPDVFGPDAMTFNPHRRPRYGHVKGYGLGFGMGEHTCLAKRLIVNDAPDPDHHGLATAVIRELVDAGVRPDPERPPVPEQHANDRFTHYGVVVPAAAWTARRLDREA